MSAPLHVARAAAARLASLALDVADAGLDPRCAAGDHALGRLLGPACAACEARLLDEGNGPRCPSCSARLGDGAACGACAGACRRLQVQAPREHRGIARALVLAMKAGRREDAARPLARATFADERARAALVDADLVVPVPADAVRRRERGFNPAEALADELARLASEAAGRRVRARAVLAARSSATGKQSSRSASERRRALRGAFRVRPLAGLLLRGRRVAVVDDVVTTGATAVEAAEVLLRAGAEGVVVVACTRAEGPLLDVSPRLRGVA